MQAWLTDSVLWATEPFLLSQEEKHFLYLIYRDPEYIQISSLSNTRVETIKRERAIKMCGFGDHRFCCLGTHRLESAF